ncbi:GIY-YIG nuclease family protein [Bradyrhizobium aeschynomenes]|uniref:GIY-YIG nuclease family protein n=1 Tax=Bradyrhizobium aeschynomenes TaxID=2734909 RepID=UPI003D3235FA
MTEGAYLYIVLCADGRLYIETTRTSLELRVAQHNDGTFGGYTLTRRPVNWSTRNGSSGSRTPSKANAG